MNLRMIEKLVINCLIKCVYIVYPVEEGATEKIVPLRQGAPFHSYLTVTDGLVT